MNLEIILGNWVPLAFGLVGIIVLLSGVVNLISGKDGAFNNIFGGLFIIAIAVGLRILLQQYILPVLL